MGRKRRPRDWEGIGEPKKIRRMSRANKETDLDFISKDDYVTVGDLMFARPYVFEFRTFYKPRWRGKTIFGVFCQEFRHAEPGYWSKEFREGRILHSQMPVGESAVWDDGMEVVHIVHRHESAVLSQNIHIAHDHAGYLVVSKPPSIPVHPCGTYRRNCLQFILKAFYGTGKLLAVHRLDKETSGLVILARTSQYASRFSEEIKEHKVQKTYLAEVHGSFPWEATECVESIFWDKREMRASVRPEGADAKTSFRKISSNRVKGTSIIECKPFTGRTHQIRVHLAHLGFPIVNDPMYGNTKTSNGSDYVPTTRDPKSLTLTHSVFKDEDIVNKRRHTYQACEWSKRALAKHEKHLTCLEEGQALSCTNCPQVTNVKNVEVKSMFIHLHALKYESENWSFQVPPPSWMDGEMDSNNADGCTSVGSGGKCIVS